MKKLATTFGLLALMLIVTSFTTPNNEIGGKSTPGDLGPAGPSAPPTELLSIGGKSTPGDLGPAGPSAPTPAPLSIGGKNTSGPVI
jgi:hypothetical protein